MYRSNTLKEAMSQSDAGKEFVLEDIHATISFGLGVFSLIGTFVPPKFNWFCQLLGI